MFKTQSEKIEKGVLQPEEILEDEIMPQRKMRVTFKTRSGKKVSFMVRRRR
jgi:hypothetical protein